MRGEQNISKQSLVSHKSACEWLKNKNGRRTGQEEIEDFDIFNAVGIVLNM